MTDTVITRDGNLTIKEFLEKIEKPLVFTNGVFDIIHVGHVNYLHEAKKMGKSLVVAVNSDDSVRLLGKGNDRPINKDIDRASILKNFVFTDGIIIFNDKTPLRIIELLKPNFYIKGGDYRIEDLEEFHLVKKWGGEAYAMKFWDGYSTSRILEKIRS